MIVLDGIVLALQRHGGISTYFRELSTRVAAVRDDVRIWTYAASDLTGGDRSLRAESRPRRVLERYRQPWDVPVGAILHSSYYRVARRRRVVNIITVYDFIYERFASGAARLVHSRQKGRAIRCADAVICISRATMQDLLHYHPHTPADRVHVIPLAASMEFSPIDESTPGERNYEFALFVGGRSGHKNFASAVRAVAEVPEMHLVCVGGGPFTNAEAQLLERQLAGRYRHAGSVPRPELNRLYNRAFCLVYPSLYEGFGIPILEAQAAGCPVIATNRSSMPEIAAGSAVLLDDPTPGAIRDALRLLSDDTTRVRYRHLGLENATRYSWDAMARATLDLYARFA